MSVFVERFKAVEESVIILLFFKKTLFVHECNLMEHSKSSAFMCHVAIMVTATLRRYASAFMCMFRPFLETAVAYHDFRHTLSKKKKECRILLLSVQQNCAAVQFLEY